MEIVFTVLILLLAVAGSGVVTRLAPLPLPLVQIAIGAMLAWPKLGLHVTFDPEIFMMLFIPPLLFADGWRIPKREFFMARRSILMLALGRWYRRCRCPSRSHLPPCCRRPMRLRFPASRARARFQAGSCTSWKAKR
jgi:hypothetical protein